MLPEKNIRLLYFNHIIITNVIRGSGAACSVHLAGGQRMSMMLLMMGFSGDCLKLSERGCPAQYSREKAIIIIFTCCGIRAGNRSTIVRTISTVAGARSLPPTAPRQNSRSRHCSRATSRSRSCSRRSARSRHSSFRLGRLPMMFGQQDLPLRKYVLSYSLLVKLGIQDVIKLVND